MMFIMPVPNISPCTENADPGDVVPIPIRELSVSNVKMGTSEEDEVAMENALVKRDGIVVVDLFANDSDPLNVPPLVAR